LESILKEGGNRFFSSCLSLSRIPPAQSINQSLLSRHREKQPIMERLAELREFYDAQDLSSVEGSSASLSSPSSSSSADEEGDERAPRPRRRNASPPRSLRRKRVHAPSARRTEDLRSGQSGDGDSLFAQADFPSKLAYFESHGFYPPPVDWSCGALVAQEGTADDSQDSSSASDELLSSQSEDELSDSSSSEHSFNTVASSLIEADSSADSSDSGSESDDQSFDNDTRRRLDRKRAFVDVEEEAVNRLESALKRQRVLQAQAEELAEENLALRRAHVERTKLLVDDLKEASSPSHVRCQREIRRLEKDRQQLANMLTQELEEGEALEAKYDSFVQAQAEEMAKNSATLAGLERELGQLRDFRVFAQSLLDERELESSKLLEEHVAASGAMREEFENVVAERDAALIQLEIRGREVADATDRLASLRSREVELQEELKDSRMESDELAAALRVDRQLAKRLSTMVPELEQDFAAKSANAFEEIANLRERVDQLTKELAHQSKLKKKTAAKLRAAQASSMTESGTPLSPRADNQLSRAKGKSTKKNRRSRILRAFQPGLGHHS
jgi:hypothetical protein